MMITPQQFGMQVGKTMGKQAFVTLPITAGVGAGLGAVTSPSGHRMEGLGRGAVKGTGTGAGMIGGGIGGALGALALAAASPRIGKTLFGPSAAQLADALKRFVQRGGRTMTRGGKKVPIRSPGSLSPYTDAYLRNAIVRGGTTGAVGGAGLGYAGASAAIGKPSWEKKEASVLSVLGGLAGGGIGGLAGGAGGGILGALGGGALGGGTGAGLGLLAGGAAGLGAGAHMGGNIGAGIGRSFSKKKEKPESDEKEEKSEEKSEDNNKEKEMDKQSMNDIVKNASAVLAQLRKNAADPRMYSADSAGATPPMSGVAGAMQRGGNTLAKMPAAGVGLVPKMMGQNISKAAPAVQAAGNKLVAGEKTMAPANTGGVPMFGIMPALAGNLGRFLGGK